MHLRSRQRTRCLVALLSTIIALTASPRHVCAQEEELEEPDEFAIEEQRQQDEGLLPSIPTPGEEAAETTVRRPFPVFPRVTPPTGDDEAAPEAEPIEGGEAGEGQTRWTVKINGAVRASYVFTDTPTTFVVKYRWEITGQINAATAVVRGDADITAEVEGFLSKWPTGECKLEVTIPKVPFDLTFQKQGEDRGTVNLQFKKTIVEDWQSKCTFSDAPGAHFDTRGDPEKWLARAIDKARPPLRSIIMDLGEEETTTSFVIGKEIIDDPPLGSVEIEGTGVVTVTPGGGE